MKDPEEARRFGRFVRSQRKLRDLKQEQLAERCSLAVDTIRRLEHGSFTPSLWTLRRLCKGLELSLTTLFTTFEHGQLDDNTLELATLLRGRGPKVNGAALRLVRAWLETLHDAADVAEIDRHS